MAEIKTLADRIAALASENPAFEAKARVLDLTDGGLAAILDEIDATVLSARLRFDAGAGHLSLDVAGRRLLRVAEAGGTTSVPADLLGATLSADTPDDLKAAATLLQAFGAGAATLRVAAEPANGAARGDSVSVAALRTALEAPEPADQVSPMDKMLEGCGDHIKAALRLEGKTVAQTAGSIAHVQALKSALSGQLETFLEARAATCASHTDPSLTLLQDAAGPGLGLCLAVIADERTLLAYDTGAVGEIFAVWKTVL